MPDTETTQTDTDVQADASVKADPVAVAEPAAEAEAAPTVAEAPAAEAKDPVADQAKDAPADAGPVATAPAAAPMAEAAPVVEEPVPEAFGDLYAASSQAFANSRALKAQKEMELEVLERSLPEAETNRTTTMKSAADAVDKAQAEAATMRQHADAEVARIKDSIATKQLEIEKAEANDVEKAEALVAILNNYITRRSG